jgi:integrase
MLDRDQNGGSARGYQVSSAPLAIPATAGQSGATAYVYAPHQRGANILSCRRRDHRWLGCSRSRAESRLMERFADDLPVRLIDSGGAADRLKLAVAAYLARYSGSSRDHVHSDLRCFLAWCAERGLDPLAAGRVHLELYIRWMQEVRRFKPSTVSRWFSVIAGFYRAAVIDGVLSHSPAEHVRRPAVPPEWPTLGFTHLQLEAMLTAARESSSPYDFALVAMLGLLGLRIFEATGADIAELGEEHGHRVLRVCGKGAKVVLVLLPPAVGAPLTAWSEVGPQDRSCSTGGVPGCTAMPLPGT